MTCDRLETGCFVRRHELPNLTKVGGEGSNPFASTKLDAGNDNEKTGAEPERGLAPFLMCA
jgi:hypothetical protein